MAHSHNHGGGHSHDDANPDDDWNLYQHLERAEVLNAVVLGEGDTTWAPNATGKALCVMRPNARRLQPGQILSSDSDEQVIVKLQFAAPVSVRKLMVIGAGPAAHHPSSVHCYVGRAAEDLDFSGLDGVVPAQIAELAVNEQGEGYMNMNRAPFTNITALALFFPANHGDEEETKLAYIGMQGDHTHGQRMAVNATYELIATPNDDALFSHSHEHHLAPNAGGRPGM